MNKIHQTIWDSGKGIWIAVSERTVSRGKRSGGAVIRLLAGIVGLIMIPSAAQAVSVWNVASGDWITAANWTGGVPVAGDLTIIGNGTGIATLGPLSAATGATGALIVGHTANGRLVILNGSTLTSNSNVQIGNVAGVTGIFTVDGSGSSFAGSNTITIGDSGTGTLSVIGGAAVSGVTYIIGNSSTGVGTVTVDGVGSSVTGTGVMAVGSAGIGTLSITNGADVVTSSSVVVGNVAGSTGTITVDGVGSTLTGTSGLTVGVAGTGSLAISNGAAVASGGTTTFGSSAGSIGTVTVDGSGSTLTNSGLLVGNAGSSTLSITNNGAVNGATVILGAASGGNGTVVVDGSGSSMTGTGTLVVGHVATGNLVVTNGADVSFGTGMQISNLAGATGTVTVDGTGSTLAMGTGGLWVGRSGLGTLTLSNGAALTSNGTDIASSATSGGSSVVVQSGATWIDTAGISIGSDSAGHVIIQTGGQVSSTNLTAGIRAGGSGSTVTVAGAGSDLTISSGINIASGGDASLLVTNSATATALGLSVGNAATGAATVSGAGTLTTGNAMLGQTSAGNGSVTVTGIGSSWTANGTITVGNSGVGTLTIDSGATVNSNGGVLANASGSTGSVVVTGTGSTWSDSGTLLVGNAGTGTLVIDDGGLISVAAGTIVGVASGSGTINLNATLGNQGVLETLALASGTGTSQANFDGGILRATANNASFITSFSGTELNIAAGGLTIDDAGFTVTTDTSAFSGTGALTKIGAGTVILVGDSTYSGGTTISAGTLQLGNGGTTGSIVGNVTDNGTLAFNRSNLYTFSGVISGGGNITQVGTGTTVLTAAHTYTGTTTVTAGTLAVGSVTSPGGSLSGGGTITIASGGTLGGYGSVTGTVSNGGTIAVANAITAFSGNANGNFTINGTLLNSGLAQIGGTGIGNTLTVNNYIGNPGSTIGLNTFLGSDGSPSDLLVIDGGTATGTSGLTITNIGGGGTLTTGNGIKVIDAINGGTTASGTFSLRNRAVAGPYEYTLFRGSTDGSDAQDWYLRSNLALNPSGSATPNYRQEVSLYSTLSSMAQIYGRTLLGTMHERVGELEQLRGNSALDSSVTDNNGVWGRFIGLTGSQGHSSIYNGSPKFNYSIGTMQIGKELYREETDDGRRDHAGVYGAIGYLSGDADHADGTKAGKTSFDAYTLGIYRTHFGASGWYVDGVAQATQYGSVNAQSSRTQGTTSAIGLSTRGHGVAASIEGGYPLQMGSGWVIEPQAQLVYQRVDLKDASDVGADVRFSNAESATGRIGGRLARTWNLDEGNNPRHATVWLSANLWREFAGNNKTELSSADGFVPFRSDLGGNWTDIGVGFSTQLTHTATVFAHANYIDGEYGNHHAYSGKFGVRVNW